MIISPATGKIIHHNDCTWCKHRIVYPKGLLAKYEVEKCAVTGKHCAHPKTDLRYCDCYQQKGCECENCTKSVIVVLQMELNLDK